MANAEVNEGRGFPLAEEPAPVTIAPHRVLLFKIIQRALRSERGVRHSQEHHKPTGYYAGRRSASISDASELCSVLYGGDYLAAKKAISEGVRVGGEAFSTEDLTDPDVLGPLAQAIAEEALKVT